MTKLTEEEIKEIAHISTQYSVAQQTSLDASKNAELYFKNYQSAKETLIKLNNSIK